MVTWFRTSSVAGVGAVAGAAEDVAVTLIVAVPASELVGTRTLSVAVAVPLTGTVTVSVSSAAFQSAGIPVYASVTAPEKLSEPVTVIVKSLSMDPSSLVIVLGPMPTATFGSGGGGGWSSPGGGGLSSPGGVVPSSPTFPTVHAAKVKPRIA